MLNRISELFQIKYPIIQGGMIWCSGWRLASAVSNAGGLGLLGAGSMSTDELRESIQKCKSNTNKPFGVNIPLLYKHSDEFIQIAIDEQVQVVFTSAGSPSKYTQLLKSHGIKVVHVIANTKFALKCEEAGVDAIVAEGFEAGGHNGIEETTTMVLLPQIRKITKLPLIAAGGIATGRGMLAAFALGAEGVQMGTRFAASEESSAHERFKQKITELKEGETLLSMKKLVPVRLAKNKFFNDVFHAENQGATKEELSELLGRGRAKKGMFEGDLDEGELEIGQVSAMIDSVLPAGKIIEHIIEEFNLAAKEMNNLYF